MLRQVMKSLAAEAVVARGGLGQSHNASNAQMMRETCYSVRKNLLGSLIGSAGATQRFRTSFSKFENEAGPRTAFPCVFARNTIKRGNLRFLLIPYEREKSRYELGLLSSGLRTYIDQINIDALDVNHNRSLLVLFEPVATLTTTDQFKHIFIEAMQCLLDGDQRPWPSHISKDPAHRTWTTCFHGCELFVNVSHPAHVLPQKQKHGRRAGFHYQSTKDLRHCCTRQPTRQRHHG